MATPQHNTTGKRRSGDPSSHQSGQEDLSVPTTTEHYNIATDNDDDPHTENDDGPHNDNDDDNSDDHDQPINKTRTSKRTRNKTRQIKAILQHTQSTLMSTYIRNKYRGLPSTAPVPPHEEWLHGPRLTFWEWWSGSSRLSTVMAKLTLANGERVTCGPPLSWETGWDLRNDSHRAAIKRIYQRRRPMLVFASPTCGPWSSSNTNLDLTTKHDIRQVELHAFNLFGEIAIQQTSMAADFVLEQSQASELLKQPAALELLQLPGVLPDQILHQCMHGAIDRETKQPVKKPTLFRGTVALTRNKTCDKSHTHQHLQGKYSDGVSRTSWAQTYPWRLCYDLSKDFVRHLNARLKPLGT